MQRRGCGDLMEEAIIKRLMTSLKCDTCGQHYNTPNVEILGHRDELWFFRVHCASCQSQCLIAATIKEQALADAVSDLNKSELHEFYNGEQVATNDVLDMHNFLKTFNGDFNLLFRKG